MDNSHRRSEEPRGKPTRIKIYLLRTLQGTLVIVTSYASVDHEELVEKLSLRGITQFSAQEVPLRLAKKKYGALFDFVCSDLLPDGDYRVLDCNWQTLARDFDSPELGTQVYYIQAGSISPASFSGNSKIPSLSPERQHSSQQK